MKPINWASMLVLCIISPLAYSSSEKAAQYTRILYHRQPQFQDYSTLIAAIETGHQITALHVVKASSCKLAKQLCFLGSLAVIGSADGNLSVLSASGKLLLEVQTDTAASVTSIASFASDKGSITIVSGHSDGSLLWHKITGSNVGAHTVGQLKVTLMASGSIPSENTYAWITVDAYALHLGRHGLANLVGVTADGQVAWGKIDVGQKRKKGGKGKEIELSYDNSLSGGLEELDESAFNGGGSADAALAVRVRRAGVDVFTAGGEMTYGPMAVKQIHEIALKIPVPCTGWAKHSAGALPYFTSLVFDNAYPSARAFAASNSGHILALHTAAAGKIACNVLGSSAKIHSRSSIEVLAAVPGYVFAVTSDRQLAVFNASGSFLKPRLDIVAQVSLEELATAVPGLGGAARGASSWLKNLLTPSSHSGHLIAAGASSSVPAAPTANGIVLVQLSPTMAALYATSLPFTPAKKPNKFKFNFLSVLQPIVLAVALGMGLRNAKKKRHLQASSAEVFKSRLRANALRDPSAAVTDDWDEPFPWEKRARSSSSGGNSASRFERMMDSRREVNGSARSGAAGAMRQRASRTERASGRKNTPTSSSMSQRYSASGLTPQPFIDRAPLLPISTTREAVSESSSGGEESDMTSNEDVNVDHMFEYDFRTAAVDDIGEIVQGDIVEDTNGDGRASD